MKRWTMMIAHTLLSTSSLSLSSLRFRPLRLAAGKIVVSIIPLRQEKCGRNFYTDLTFSGGGHSGRLKSKLHKTTTTTVTTTSSVPWLRWCKHNNRYNTRIIQPLVILRGGSSCCSSSTSTISIDSADGSTDSNSKVQQQNLQKRDQTYTVLSSPAPGSPFHYAFPVHDLTLAKEFYGTILGCVEGRSSTKWQDYSLHGHQIVAHWVGDNYRCHDYYNPVDGDEVPVPHTGLALTVEQFHELANRLRKAGVEFIIEPHLRFKGMPGEQYTMFFKDPSGNNLEFKAMTHPENLFAKYNVIDS